MSSSAAALLGSSRRAAQETSRTVGGIRCQQIHSQLIASVSCFPTMSQTSAALETENYPAIRRTGWVDAGMNVMFVEEVEGAVLEV